MFGHWIEGLAVLIGLPLFVYVVFRAAGLGWFGVKHYYQRRFINGIREGEKENG